MLPKYTRGHIFNVEDICFEMNKIPSKYLRNSFCLKNMFYRNKPYLLENSPLINMKSYRYSTEE